MDAADIMFLHYFLRMVLFMLFNQKWNDGCCAWNFSTEDWQLCPAIDSDHNADSWF